MAEKLIGTEMTETQDIIAAYSDDKADVYAMPSMGIAVVFSSATSSYEAKGKKFVPKRYKDAPKENSGYSDIEPYDTDNQHPQRLKKLIESNSKLQVGLWNKAVELLGHGIETGIYQTDENTQEDGFKFQRQQEWIDWVKAANTLVNYEVLAARSLVSHYISFVSLILNEDKSKVIVVKARSPLNCRLSKIDATGHTPFCYYSEQWHNNPSIEDIERVQKIPVLDTWFLDFDAFREQLAKGKETEYMLVVRVPTDDSPYPYPDYLSVVRQKYVELSNNVPIWKSAIMKHQTTLNQILYVSEEYYRLKYPNWQIIAEKAKAGDKESIAFVREKREKVAMDIHDQITGIDKSGKMILGHLLSNPNNFADKNLQKSFIVEAVETVQLDGKWIPDGNEADRQILFAIDVDAAQYGGLPGATDTGGSNKRESSNNSQLRKYVFEELQLSVYRFVRDFNQMGDFDFRIKRALTPTLDQVTAKDRQLNQPK